MRGRPDTSLVFRILLPLLLILAFGLALHPAELDRELKSAREMLERGEYEGAAQMLTKLAGEFPWRNSLWEEAGRAALNAGLFEEAIRDFNTARADETLTIDGFVLLGDAYRLVGDDLNAVDAWAEALARQADPPVGLAVRLAELQEEQGDFSGAQLARKRLVALEPGNAAHHYALALLLAATDPEAALPQLEQLGELDPAAAKNTAGLSQAINTARFEDEPAYTLLAAGRELGRLDEWQLAAEAFRRATELRPDYPDAWAYLGDARRRLREDGLEELNRALELQPDSIPGRLFLAAYQREKGQSALALTQLYKAAALQPANPFIEVETGRVLAEMGDLINAESHFRRAFSLATKDTEAYKAVAGASLDYNLQLPVLGRSAARQAVLLAPKEAAARDILGQVYTRLGDPASARRAFLKALELEPDYAPAYLHLGVTELLLGDPQSAAVALRKAIELAPDSVTAAQAERLLQGLFP